MRLDLFWLLDRYPGETAAGVTARVLDETRLAEELGFEGCWYAEHHFSDYGVCPAPAVLMAAAAAATTRVRLGAAVAVLPLNHPIRLAEDYATVDVISGGRLDLGVGTGFLHDEYAGFAVPHGERRARFDESLELLTGLWADGIPERAGGVCPGPAVSLNLRPVQRPRPPIWIAVVRAEAVRPVARRGFPILTLPYAFRLGDRELELFGDAYRSTYAGLAPPGLTAAYHAYVATNTPAARAAVVPYLDRYLEHRVQQARFRPDDLLDEGLAIVGDAAACADRIRRLERAGVTHLLLMMSFGGMPAEMARESMERMAREVMPEFRGVTHGSPAHLAT
jgi:alkanesulfonate monooxygenase SsuD/methylene tetrahydromethanopterin reductase-like flavin-dependent oxidoreductase (luciferase family)